MKHIHKSLIIIILLTLVCILAGCVNPATDKLKSNTKAITEFSLTNPATVGTINESSKSIDIKVPFGTPLTALIPKITSTGTSVSPASGTAQDFTKTVPYTVTAEDASTQIYYVTVTVAPSAAKAITSFNIVSPAVTGVINETAKTITVTVPDGTVVTNLIPTIVITGTSVFPDSDTAKDFTNPVTYTVTAADASTQAYKVSVVTKINKIATAGAAMDVCISGNYAYVSASEAGLQIFDISTPAIPTLACTVDTPGIAWHTTVSGNFAYVADHGISGSPNSFIRKINVTNPASATMSAGVDIANSNTDPGTIAISGNYAYIGYSGDGIYVFSTSSLTYAGSFNTTGHANGIAISGNSLYVADAASGLQILDISTPGAPSLAKTVSTTNARYVAVSGNYAYVADSTGGLRIIDISTTSAASVVKTITSTGDATNICVDGNVAYVTASDNKIWVVDISVPANATLSSSFTIDGTPSAIAVSNGYLFVAIGSKGFLTIKK